MVPAITTVSQSKIGITNRDGHNNEH